MELAIVIPYYKLEHFKEALASVKNQTIKQFKLYIGDDSSKDDPLKILEEILGDEIPYTYHRFEDNLGSFSLTKQWERCIALTSEKFIWVFGDDDLMPKDAVERFYKILPLYPGHEFFRFGVEIINEKDEITYPYNKIYDQSIITAEAFLHSRLKGELISTLSEYIFSKELYLLKKGFVDFPLAWASDDATWINFASANGIVQVDGEPISWRMGQHNISSKKSYYKEKTMASISFINFFSKKYKIDDQLKLKWLNNQVNLFGNDKKIKLYFWWKVCQSGIVPLSYLLNKTKRYLFEKKGLSN